MSKKKCNTTDEEMLDILLKLHIQESEAKILIVLNKNVEGLKQKDICLHGYMYQPEVSKGLKKLMSKGWVAIVHRTPTENRGRPYAIYAMMHTWNEILVKIQSDVDNSYESVSIDIEKAKKLA